MVNVPEQWGAEEYKDVAAVNYFRGLKERYPNNEHVLKEVLAGLQRVGCDNTRTPVD